MKWTTIVSILLLTGFAYGQEPLSPPARTSVTIGGKKLTLAYSSPSIRGRKIMGGLVPYGRWWRTGADNATTLQTDADLDMGGLKVPKGTYTIYTLPNATEWQLIVNKQTGQWGTEYNQRQDLGRVKMNLAQTPALVDSLKIDLSSTGGNKGLLKMTWERTEVSVPFTVQ
jgi:Protein of unknown function (DUF2911)